MGLVQHIDLCVHRHLADGSLVRMLVARCRPFPGFYLYYVPSRAQMPAKIRALMDFLIEMREQLAQSRQTLTAGNRRGRKGRDGKVAPPQPG
jgi:DNA-binding transcriptional LysR family regulator